nr:cupin domain-containing protein [Dysgonomonas sp. GY617]
MKQFVIIVMAFTASLFTSCNNNTKTNNDMETSNNLKADMIFPKGDKLENNNFSGTAWLQMLVTNQEAFDMTIGNVTFESGVRNSWHSHPGGQILLCTDGTGYYQEKGKPIQILNKGDVVEILPNVVHWHGATPDSEFTHIAISTKIGLGPAVWLAPVTDEEYNSLKK